VRKRAVLRGVGGGKKAFFLRQHNSVKKKRSGKKFGA